MQKGFAPILIILGIVLILGISGGAYYLGTQKPDFPLESKNYGSKRENPSPTQSITSQSPLMEAIQQDEIPSSPVSSKTPINESLTTKTLSYNLPSGWKIVQSYDGVFEVGYDPSIYQAGPSEAFLGTIGISKSGTCCFHFYIDIRPYDGGSRHQFIYRQDGDSRTAKTYEKNYEVNGKSALVMYNIDGSSSLTTGMMVIDNTRAFSFSYSEMDEEFVEKTLASVKILK